jgi:hypothetical protein
MVVDIFGYIMVTECMGLFSVIVFVIVRYEIVEIMIFELNYISKLFFL